MLLLLPFKPFHLMKPKRLGTRAKMYRKKLRQKRNPKSTTNPTKILVPSSAPKTVIAAVGGAVEHLVSVDRVGLVIKCPWTSLSQDCVVLQ